MRRFLYLLLAIASALPALAAKPITVDELDQQLARLKGKSDNALANELSGLQLTERATSTRLARWSASLPGSRSRDALTALVDASAFLDLPPSDLASAPAPDQPTQDQIMARAVERLKAVYAVLPNFYATRDTTHFEDAAPRMQNQTMQSMSGSGRRGSGAIAVDSFSSISTFEPLHRTARFDVTVSYRDGNEVVDSPKGKQPEAATGLTTTGEFGPILFLVFDDARRGKISWGHWEQGLSGTLAVFRFSVSEPESHFFVTLPNGANSDTLHPAYRGEISVDPDTGDIYRVTEVAEMQPPQEKVRANLLVEYAPVTIGDRNYICPVRGVAIIKMPISSAAPQAPDSQALQTYLNDEVFTQYHLFRGDARIVPQ